MSAIDICNAALVKNHHIEAIPDTADLTNPVGKAQILCARFYDLARRESLRLAPWTCVKKRVILAKDEWEASTEYAIGDKIVSGGAVWECTTAGTSAAVWAGLAADGTVGWTNRYDTLGPLPTENLTGLAYAFALPADYINQIEVQDSSGKIVHFELERQILYSNVAAPVLIYVPDEIDDLMWDDLLKDVIITQLAGKIAYGITGSHENEVAYAQAAMGLAQAATMKTKREARQGAAEGIIWAEGIFEPRRTP